MSSHLKKILKNKVPGQKEEDLIVQQKKEMDIFKRHQGLKIEADILASMTGIRFEGELDVSRKQIAPTMRLREISCARVKVMREGLASLSVEGFKEMGYDVVFPERPLWYDTVLLLPAWVRGLFRGYTRRYFMQQYRQSVARHMCAYKAFLGDQKGMMCSLIDIQDVERVAEEKAPTA